MGKKQRGNNKEISNLAKRQISFENAKDRREQIVKCVLAFFSTAKLIVPLWLLEQGVEFVIKEATTKQIGALTKLLEAVLAKNDIPFYCLLAIMACVFVPAIMMYRIRIARLTRELSKARAEIEANDPQRSSSGLTVDGQTPAER